MTECRDCMGTGCPGQWVECECCLTCDGTGEVEDD